jgi:hypothetical protein
MSRHKAEPGQVPINHSRRTSSKPAHRVEDEGDDGIEESVVAPRSAVRHVNAGKLGYEHTGFEAGQL